ncbi:pleckstrin homology domain-containing family G member 5 isoform X2 [Silurus meridionalis]|uniref:pleckstrin homology domain-containing family G member 5 isoform X2 n=1 Tax=Silurus meridionalis TaxID=175797 RepID=UPI001EEA37EB|nr:pleckstrin homology domain-containing family G member 5 isoform X2 [Silurus meridionalis]
MPYHEDKNYIMTQRMNGGVEKHREEVKDKESDTADEILGRNADAPLGHQRAADNHKYHTLGYQKKKPKVRLVATLGKGSPTSKSRGAPIQGLFDQGPTEKTSMQEERGNVGGGQSQLALLKQTLQSFALPDELKWWWKEGEKDDILEINWTDIVHSHKSMARIQKHQQEAIWELLQTELIYINKLTIITDLVLAALEHVHRQGFLLEVSAAQLFSNICSIRDAHKCFWLEVIYPMLQNVKMSGQPFDPLKLDPGCLQFADRFSAYLDYCWEAKINLEFTHRQMEINPHFNIFRTWVETHPQCMRMRLGDMQAKPHQRITKYPLLLKAILKATEDINTQKTLSRMINSVSQFLDSINDYLLFKDDELAIFDLSQKIEGYELPGMSEEIEKEFCQFDLTSPIRGMGPRDLRKLIKGENLKVRGRKDSKLEVFVLLFTDVLLLTKPQKKSEKHKVVRPPLSLERIHCAELKDGYSFVILEVSDLGCPVSVYSVSTPSPESCAAWITNIHQAQETLKSLRKKETVTLEEPSDQILEESDPLPLFNIPNIKDAAEQFEYTSLFASLFEKEGQNLHNQPAHSHFSNKQMQNQDKEFNNDHNTTQETKESEREKNGHCKDGDILYGPAVERRVTWNHKHLSDKNSKAFPQQDILETNKSSGPHLLLVGGLREKNALSQSSSSQFLLPSKFIPVETESVKHQPSQKPDLWQNSWSHQSGDENESLSESWTFTRTLNSPRLRRKRPMNSQLPASLQNTRRMSAEAEILTLFTNMNSKSVSDSGKNHNICKPSDTTSKSQDHLVLKMGSVKQNRGAFWNFPFDRISESESELSKETHNENAPKNNRIKPQRTESLPELQSSPLQGILKRAKERDRERGIVKKEGKHLEKTSAQSSNTFPHLVCTSPSPSPSYREKEAATEEQELFRSRWYDSHTETSVDSSYNDRNNRPITSMGVNVDWPGWCFDDEDVLEFTGLDDKTLDCFEQAPTSAEYPKTPRHSEADYSEV